jgi:hypothetical protein
MGKPLGKGKGRMGREREGGGQFTSNLGPEWTGIAPHTKEGLQVSGLENKGGSPGKGEIKKGNYQGVCAMCSDIVNLYIHIVLLCVCG